jgi:hypothetical protein
MALKRESAKLVRGYEQSDVRSHGETARNTAQHNATLGAMAAPRTAENSTKTPICVKIQNN